MNRIDTRQPADPGAPRRSPLPLLVFAVSIAVLSAAAIRFVERAFSADRKSVAPRSVAPRGDLSADEQNTIEIFERCSRSVVYVSPRVTRLRRTLFFTDTVVEAGTGSGFVWDQQGNIVTNFHVIKDAESCVVTLPDNSTFEAELVGIWPDKDVAVLRIEAPPETLHPISVGSSANLRVGQKVLAIGNPYGLDFTLTTGVISALNRSIEAITGRKIHDVIQTDAAINPGNSGGPLLDSAGRLIGITTAIISGSGHSAGLGFAVPIDTVNDIVPQLIAYGRVIRPGLGVNIASDDLSRRLKLGGVLILHVTAGSGAELAGLRPTTLMKNGRTSLGDVIIQVGKHPTPNADALLHALEQFEVGDTVVVTVDRRGGERITVPITLQAMN